MSLYGEAPGEPSSEDLADRFRDGDESAFEQLYRRYVQEIHRYVYRMLEGTTAASGETPDVVHRILLKMMLALTEGVFDRTVGNFDPWLFGIVRHELQTARRTRRRRPRELPLDETLKPRRSRRARPSAPLRDEPLEGDLDQDSMGKHGSIEDEAILKLLVAQFLGQLPLRIREVYLLWDLGFREREIAVILGIPSGTVAKRKSRFLRMGKTWFGRHLHDHEGEE